MPFENKAEAVIEGRTATLLWDLRYQGRDQPITVPRKFTTDFASVPQFLSWLIPSMGMYTYAAIVHDYLCEQLNAEHREGAHHVLAPVNARDTDGIFRRIMREAGVPPLRRALIWTGVRWGALFNPARREGWLRDAPAVLGLSLLALPIVLPASIPVGLGSLLYWLLEKIVGWFA